MNNQTEDVLRENRDSIKIAKNSKGYTWEIKRYYDFSRTKPENVIAQITQIDKQLHKALK